MNYTGIDYHKRYSVACTLDAQGRKLHEAKIEHNAPAAFAAYFKKLGCQRAMIRVPSKGSGRDYLIYWSLFPFRPA